MERQAERHGTKRDKRGWGFKAWKGFSIRPNFLFIAVLCLAGLLVAKIIISGLYLHFDSGKLQVANVAIAQETSDKKADVKATDTKSPDADLTAKQASLKKKELELKERESAVQRKEQELAPLQAEVDAKIEQLNELQVKLTAMAKELAEKEQTAKDEKITHLVALYSSMDAAKAAKILDKLNTDIVVRILANMKGKSAGQILAAMSTDKGAIISESLSKTE
jgi:flagellar motility protein MotE (MotC chaperone)